MRIESWVGVTMVLLTMLGGAIAAESQQRRPSPLPSNICFPRYLERPFLRIYDGSPTFRAQCERIGEAGNLRITVRIDPDIPSRCRAFTIMERRRDGEIRAEVHLPPSANHAELLAHEFEHVLEQIEGLDLRRLARAKGSGVREVHPSLFESDRAHTAGLVVEAEADQWAQAAD